ncbi:Uncharacterized protein MLTONO_p0150 (plasmid) [Mesorhizobium loti]|nr:Uncharacterized protein MLTONO_p0150 [Mesorhizobium loti]
MRGLASHLLPLAFVRSGISRSSNLVRAISRKIVERWRPSFSAIASTLTPAWRQHLWAKDRALNAIYLFIRSYDNPKVRKALLANQRDWIKQWNSCGSKLLCLNQSYDIRFQLMKAIDVGPPSNGG